MAKTIFDFLKSFDKKDFDLFNKITDEERVELEKFVSYLSLRYMSAAENDLDHQLLLCQVNDINRTYFSLYRHKELQAKLMAYCGVGNVVRHIYIKAPQAEKNEAIHGVVRMRYPDASKEDCDMYLRNCSAEEFKSLCLHTGHSPKNSKQTSDKPSLEDLEAAFKNLH